MNLTHTLRTIWLVARLQLHRAWRRARDRPHVLLAQIGFFVAAWLYVIFIGPNFSGPELSTASSTDVDPEQIRTATRGLVATLWLFNVGVAAKGTPHSSDQVPGGTFLLRAAGIRPTLWGSMLAEYARRLAFLGFFAVATAVTLLWGFGLPARDPLLLLTVLFLFLSAEVVGMALRLGVAAAGIRPSRGVLVVLAGVGLSILSLAFGYPEVALGVLSTLPVGAFGEVFLTRVPGVSVDRTATVRIVVLSMVTVPILGLVVERAAQRAWFSSGQRQSAGTDRTRVGEWLATLGIEGPARAVAWRLWLQSRRQPTVLGLVAVPFLIIGLGVVDPQGTHLPVFPLFIGLYAVWMTGVTITLNPFSSENGTLPHLLSGAGRDVVGGYALTASVVGIPVTVGAIVMAGLFMGPLWAVFPSLLISVAVFVGVIPAGIAIGLLLPRLKPVAAQVDGPITPGKFAIAGFSVVLLLLSTPSYVVLALNPDSGLSIPVIATVSATILVSVLLGVSAFNYAGARLETLTLD
jgi:hypothetical protein